MNIDTMTVAIRPMSSAQALDLGMAMTRRWFIPLWTIWMGMALPIYLLFYIGGILVNFGFDWSMGVWGGVLFWWLKPLYEKPMLSWLGQALFSEAPSAQTSIRSGWRTLKDHAFILLVKKRLSMQRQLILPILMLERPTSAQFNARLQILSRGQSGSLGWHTIVMVHIEMILSLSVIVFLWQLIPAELIKTETLFSIIDYAPHWMELLWGMVYFMAVSIVAPFFVTGGFAVYLTKRCLLEGWDIELVFKQLRIRHERSESDPLRQLVQSSGQPQTPSLSKDEL